MFGIVSFWIGASITVVSIFMYAHASKKEKVSEEPNSISDVDEIVPLSKLDESLPVGADTMIHENSSGDE